MFGLYALAFVFGFNDFLSDHLVILALFRLFILLNFDGLFIFLGFRRLAFDLELHELIFDLSFEKE